jgi:serine/threonine protein kinase
MSDTRSYGELPRHLSAGLSTIQWVDSTLPSLVPEEGDRPEEPRPDLFETGAVIDGTYEVRRVLGSGGMGQVFEARDLGLNRLVAVKVAWPGIGAASLKKEAQVLAAFRHPGLATVHALGSVEGNAYMVMERLSGASLAEFLARRASAPLPLGEGLYLIDGICEALAPVHASGLAHADLKPANIMLLPGGRIVLLDFGIARIEQLREGGQRISGSPHYMAPEAIRGLVSPGSAHLIDLYALGVIAFVMLAGAPPFDAANPVELMMSHVHDEAPKLADRRPGAPQALEALIGELLAKDPADRPADIDVVRAELRRIRERIV